MIIVEHQMRSEERNGTKRRKGRQAETSGVNCLPANSVQPVRIESGQLALPDRVEQPVGTPQPMRKIETRTETKVGNA